MALTQDQLLQLLSKIPNFDIHQDISFQYLSQGLTNENYKIITREQTYVLRFNHPLSVELGINRADESRILTVVAQTHFAPEIITLSEKENFRLSRWVDGTVWDQKTIKKNINLNRLAQQLRQLHSLNMNNLPRMNLLSRIEGYRTLINQRSEKLPLIERNVLTKAIGLLQSMQQQLAHCLCHNDLTAANILERQGQSNTEIVFLDWEYAAVNAPIFEIAVICQSNELSADETDYLLNSYINMVPEIDVDIQMLEIELRQWQWIYDYISILWNLAMLPMDLPFSKDLDSKFSVLNDTIHIY